MRRADHFSISTQSLERRGIEFQKHRFMDLEPPVIMGILNITPDSFSDGGFFLSIDDAVARAHEMVNHGAAMVDVGGESTRPFAEPVPLEEEIRRTLPVIERLVDELNVPISIDTRHQEVARAAIEAGASIVNDVNALRGPGMEDIVLETGVCAVIMHMKGTPLDMQVSPSYDDVMEEILSFLKERVEHMTEMGIRKDRLILDPGIGFGKRVGDNLTIIRELSIFLDIGCPVLVGASRKSFIGKVLGREVNERLEGSLVSAVLAVMNGASIIRAHDVGETKRALDMLGAIIDPEIFK
ncbi:MAG: dihydropteroate synthase [Candidatus Thermoplasmatota archaeon]|nr:dihydropteroate synthase [Candidatus Thermoplasmatota archaeon]